MITRATREYSDEEVRQVLEPEVRRWFDDQFAGFTPPQRYAVREIHSGKNVLISSPTGSGKTLSAFLACINELAGLAGRNQLEDRVYAVYVSPLKALGNDIRRNLQAPLEGIRATYEAAGLAPPPIRVGVRTGDTPTSERAKQTRKPPHILITTPESLAILLVAPKFREHLRKVRWVILDEVHALAENKRGTHLSLSLERLERLTITETPPVRVGLSATIAPLEAIGAFVFGAERPGLIVDVQAVKNVDITVMAPVPDLVRTPGREVSDALYDTLDRLIGEHRTTLVFTNTRSGTERIVHQLRLRYGTKYAELGNTAPPHPDNATEDPSFVAAHHGSLSRERRLEVEERLKRGELKCVVCSTSLELGIDIGAVDLVLLLGSPKGIARALQRIGRAGHNLGAISKGILVARDRDDLVECTVLAKKARERRMDRIRIPGNALDVLCQHLVGMALESRWSVTDALALVRRAHPYRDLPEEDLRACLRYLAGGEGALEARHVYGKIWYDAETDEFGRRGKMLRAIYSMNVGTIPDTTLVKVMHGPRYVGEVDEEFVENLVPGDVFVLGGEPWAFRSGAGMKAQVEPAPGRSPTVPSWTSEQLPLSKDLARDIRAFRGELAARIAADEDPETTKAFLQTEYHVNALTSEAIYGYFLEQARFAGIPTDRHLLVEEFVDDDLRRNYVFHTLIGRRAHEALARAFGKHVGTRKGVNVRVQVNDNGFALQVPRGCVLTVTEIRKLFDLDLETVLAAALQNTELLKRRFRHVATRSFLILRNYAGRSKTVGRQQVNSFVLYHVLRKLDPTFPVLREVQREIRDEALDVPTATDLCRRVQAKDVEVTLARRLRAPSPFAHNLVVQGSQDAVMMEDRRSLIRDLHERVMEVLADAPDETHARAG